MEEFMPVPASEAVTSELAAAQHSLRKWRGLLLANVEKHGITRKDIPGPEGSNCALCCRHDDECDKCSLALSRGNVPCDDRIEDVERVSPYHAYTNPRYTSASPLPMIEALEQTERDIIAGKLDLEE